MRELLTTVQGPHPDAERSRQIRGTLHATSVCDRHLSVEIHPDDGGRPVTVVFRPAQIDAVRAALCRRVTIHGMMRRRAFGVTFVDLDHIDTVADNGT